MSDSDIAKRFAGLSREQRAALFQQLKEKKAGAQAGPPSIRRQSRESRVFPVSFAQQRLWVLDQFEPNNSLYNIPELFWVRGPLDPEVLRRALEAIVNRHEALRTTFVAEDGVPMQVIAERATLPLPLVELRDHPADDRADEALLLAIAEAGVPFDLARGPLVRATLLRLEQELHILLLVMHHIVSDGWSMGVLIREVAALYEAFSAGKPASLPELPIQYADFAVWQRQWLQGETLERQLGYWKRQLADLPMLQLPADRPRPAVPSHRGAKHTALLPRSLAGALKSLGQQEQCSLFIVLLAAFDLLLARHSGQEDIPVGTIIANRNRAEIEPLIGCFVNTLVLRTDLSGDPSFREVLRRVRETTLGAYDHQDLPFEKLVDELRPERDLGHTPLVQVMCILQNAPLAPPQLSDVTISSQKISTGTEQFDLSLFAIDQEHGLALEMTYALDLFDAATTARMLGRFQVLLEALAGDPDRRLSAAPLLTGEERRQLLVDWSQGSGVRGQESGVRSQESGVRSAASGSWCLHQLFEVQAAVAPDAAAVVFDSRGDEETRPALSGNEGRQGDKETGIRGQGLDVDASQTQNSKLKTQNSSPNTQHLTYHALNIHANQLAHHLLALGVGPETLVGLSMDRSLELVVGILGVLKAGGAYVPLDPTYPPNRLAFMLTDSHAAVLLTQARLADALPPFWAPVISLDADWASIAQEPAHNPDGALAPENLCYLIYTSGSTGAPKGVLVAHGGACAMVQAQIDAFDVRPESHVLQFASISFDASVSEIFTALAAGATLYMGPREAMLPGAALIDRLRDQQITTATLPPSALAVLPAESLPALQTLVSAGEPCTGEIVARWASGRQFLNAYGPTETTVCATIARCRADEGRPAIGRPIAGSLVYVLDARLEPAPIGVPGALYVGGDGLARGYLNRPDLTAERFIPNPFAGVTGDGCWVTEDSDPNTQHPTPNTRLYKTGDIARYRSNGVLEYLGRSDHQVKVRGYRIEPGEIEAALGQHPAVQRSVVVAREDRPGEMRLVAYVVQGSGVRGQGSDVGESQTQNSKLKTQNFELRAFLKERLPDYMVPSVVVLLEALPLTPSGKVDRKALPAPDGARPDLADTFVAPRTPVEETLARVWAEILGIDRVGANDNFFDLGGDSILIFKMIARARQEGFQIAPRQVFQHQTVAALAEVVGVGGAQADQGLATGTSPLTPPQLSFLEQHYQHHDYFSIATVLEAQVALTHAQWQEVTQQVLLHHDALRLRLVRAEDGYHMVHVDPDGLVAVTRVDATTLPDDQVPPLIGTVMVQQQTSFKMTEGPLMKVVMVDRGSDRPSYLLLICHHLVADAFSWQILLADFDTACQQVARGEAIALPPKTTSFKQWAEQLAEYARSEELQAELDYWLAEPHERVAALPLDFPDGANTFGSAANLVVQLGVEETQALLRDVTDAYDVQIEDVLLAAFGQSMAGWVGLRPFLIEQVGHGRVALFDEEDIDLSRTVGWLSMNFPVLLDLGLMPGPADALRTVKEELQQIPRWGMGYAILRYLSPNPAIIRRFQTLPQVEVVLNYLGELATDSELTALRAVGGGGGPRLDPQGIRPRVLVANVTLVNDQLRMTFEYSGNLHERSTIAALAERMTEALRSIIAHCQDLMTSGYAS